MSCLVIGTAIISAEEQLACMTCKGKCTAISSAEEVFDKAVAVTMLLLGVKDCNAVAVHLNSRSKSRAVLRKEQPTAQHGGRAA